MEKLWLFGMIIFLMGMLFLLWMIISVAAAYRKRKKLKPIQYLTYNRQHFDRNFEFTCEYCGNKVTTKATNCTQCGGSYGENKEYKSRKRATDLKYLEFLKSQEERIQQETTYIEETLEALRKNKVMKYRFYNFELGERPSYRPATNFEFTCEYCSTKLRGRSTDVKTCPNCDAGYSNNIGLLVAEEEEKLEKSHYQEYLTLKDIEWNQNIENEKKDAFFKKHAGGIALLAILFMFAIAYVFSEFLYNK
uniref:hypothetical protein n=1 Tax=Acetatifactor sp. TaxID=1872090 RepID=UPI004055A42D